jgi:hypothetical protein
LSRLRLTAVFDAIDGVDSSWYGKKHFGVRKLISAPFETRL